VLFGARFTAAKSSFEQKAMTRPAQLPLLLSVIIVGMNLMGCAQPTPVDTPTPGVTPLSSPIHLTRTAEAAAVQTIEAALAAEEPPPAAVEGVTPGDVEATAQALAHLYVAQTAQAMPTVARTATATSWPATPIIIVVTATPVPATDTSLTPTLTQAEREAQVAGCGCARATVIRSSPTELSNHLTLTAHWRNGGASPTTSEVRSSSPKTVRAGGI
jgi:hypothetical protein